MVRPRLIAIAETVLLDATTNSMSLIKIFEQFFPAGYPMLLPRFVVFAMFERDPGDPAVNQAEIQIKLDAEVIAGHRAELNFGGGLLNRAVLQFESFVIPRPGSVRAVAIIGDQSLESYPIRAVPAGPPPVVQVA
jgi:hypothetical protein